MLTLHGSGVGSGIAIGEAVVLDRDRPEIPEYLVPAEQIEAEVSRFQAAIERAGAELAAVRDSIPSTVPSETATFIDAHILMLQDPVLAEEPLATIRGRRCNAEWALNVHCQALVEVFDAMEDPYLRSKKNDVEQVINRIYKELLNTPGRDHDILSDDLSGKIVITNDLTPADAVLLQHHHMSAFVTNLGGPISHTAILARSLRVPAVVGLHGAIRYIRHGEPLVVDAGNGIIIVSPDSAVLREYEQRQREEDRLRERLSSLIGLAASTRDGTAVTLSANIELPGDIEAAVKVGANGVGLYRTEFLFMNRSEPPGEEEQYSAYTTVVTRLQRPVTIRTLDLGADKQVDGGRSGGNIATNPALGLRAVRLCLSDPGLFRPQLRAILRASAHGPAAIMIPMVSSLDELDQVLEMIRETKTDLRHEGYAFDPAIPVGGMIEVPAAAIAADLFAAKLDFLSIGTNDLIQYTLAIDRVDDEVNYLYDPLHPSVLRLIYSVIKAGREAGIPVSMCGEMAGEARYTRLLLGLGLRSFSMDPTVLLEVKNTIRHSHLGELEEQTREILTRSDSGRIRELLDRLNSH